MISLHQALSFSSLCAKSKPAKAVFWTGCAPMKLGGGIMEKTYNALKKAVPDLGFSSWCCAKPTFATGSCRQKAKRQGQLLEHFEKSGIKQLYTLCPNCKLTASEHFGIEALSAWPLLAEYTKKFPAQGRNFVGDYILHDPCSAKNDTSSHKAVREILDARGAKFTEFECCKEKPLCCGRKNMLFATNPSASRELLEKRIGDAKGLPIISYCESCVEAFRGAGHPAYNLLEILFDVKVTRSHSNRIKNAKAL